MTAFAERPREPDQDRRRSERFGMDRTTTATLSTADGEYRCSLEDISYGGLRVRFDSEVPDCGAVVLEHGLVGKLHGTAAWQGGSTMGIELQVGEGELEHTLQCVGLLVSPDEGSSRD